MTHPVRAQSIFASLLTSLVLALPAQAQTPQRGESVYRVELIVFEHVGGRSDQRPAAEPLNFSDALDPNALTVLTAAREEHLEALATTLPTLTLPPRSGPEAPRLVHGDEQVQPVPEAYTAVALSPAMRGAQRRLDASPVHRPVATLAWFQGATAASRTAKVRVHDAQVVAFHRPTEPTNPSQQSAPGSALGRDLRTESIPVARPIHRIDGTARLRRTQFLRLELDLVLQQPPTADDSTMPDPRWQLHRLQQARSVRPNRFEYFDSSRFGVLARITEFERVEPKIAAVPEFAPAPKPTPADSD